MSQGPRAKAYLDASALIYSVEGDPKRVQARQALTEALSDPSVAVCTSVLALAEVMVKPLRDNCPELVEVYQGLLGSGGVELIAVTREIAEKGAELRAKHNLKLVDAIHLATALSQGCGVVFTGDEGWSRAGGEGLRIVLASP